MADSGASRTVIREAISVLSSRGLIKSRPRFRAIVRRPDFRTVLHPTGSIVQHLLNRPGGVKNVHDSLLFVEHALLRDAAVAATKDQNADLKAALAANEAVIPDPLAFYQTDVAFYGVLYGIPEARSFSQSTPAIPRGLRRAGTGSNVRPSATA